MPVKIYEPHPSIPQNTYIYSGRGGAGNRFKAPKTTSPSLAQGPASLFTHGLPSTSSSKFSSGRGGAGNIHSSKNKEIYDFDKELERDLTRTKTSGSDACYVGRGGAGNLIWNMERREGSVSSRGSGEGKSGVWGRLSGAFGRR